MRKNTCIFESELKDGKINWFIGKSGHMVHIIGKLNYDRFTEKSYHISKRGLTSNNPSVIFPSKDRDAGEQIWPSDPDSIYGEQWEINYTSFFEVYPELRGKSMNCSCKNVPFYG